MAITVPPRLLIAALGERLVSRPGRLVRALLAVGGLAIVGASFAFTRERSVEELTRQSNARVSRAATLAARLDAQLKTYGATRESETSWFGKATTLLAELNAESRALDDLLPGVSVQPRGRMAELLPALAEAVERARANVEASRTLMALDVIESNGLPASESLLLEIDNLQNTVAKELGLVQRRWRLWTGATLASWATAWALGMVALLRRPGNSQSSTTPASASPPSGHKGVQTDAALVASNLSEAAGLCEALAQVRQEDELPPIMEAIARLLGASGVVMWVPREDGLVVGTFHGYAGGLAERLGRVALSEDNLLTQTWHGRQAKVAPAGPERKGAIVMPILGAGGMAGILAVEFPAGIQLDAVRVATAKLVAAQLSAVIATPATASALPEPQGAGHARASA